MCCEWQGRAHEACFGRVRPRHIKFYAIGVSRPKNFCFLCMRPRHDTNGQKDSI